MKRMCLTALFCGTVFVLYSPSAHAAIVKISDFQPAGPGLTENPGCDGVALLTYARRLDKTAVLAGFTELKPNTTYGVQLDSDMGGFSHPQAFTTNSCGNGSFHMSVMFDRTSNPVVTIYVWDGDAGTVSEVSESELRAVGAPEQHELD